jgi:copper chaperone CopZ
MSCAHCSARVEKALNAIDGVDAKVTLSEKIARVILSKDVSDKTLKEAVEKEGYTVKEIR